MKGNIGTGVKMNVFANRFAGRRAVVTGASGGIGRAPPCGSLPRGRRSG